MDSVPGVSGSTWVGHESTGFGSNDFGVIYQNGQGLKLNDPNGGQSSLFTGLSGSTVVGYSIDSVGANRYHCFTETSGNFTDFDVALPNYSGESERAMGISGNTIVGSFTGGDFATHGFVDVGGAFAQVDVPGSFFTEINGINGATIVGDCSLGGFVDINGAFTLINPPDNEPGSVVYVTGVVGSSVVGWYTDSQSNTQSFVATPVPEPSTILALTAFLGCLPARRRRCRKSV